MTALGKADEKNTGKMGKILEKLMKNTGKMQKKLEKSGKFVSPKKWEPCHFTRILFDFEPELKFSGGYFNPKWILEPNWLTLG